MKKRHPIVCSHENYIFLVEQKQAGHKIQDTVDKAILFYRLSLELTARDINKKPKLKLIK